MQNQYNQSGFASTPWNRSRGRGRGQGQGPGYLCGMNSTSFTHFGEHQQSNQNRDCVYISPNQMSAPSKVRHHVLDKVQNPRQSHENWRRMGQQDIVRLSETLAFLLRHGAEKLGFHFMPGGFLYVDELLRYHKPLNGFTLEQIKEFVRTNDKKRFYLQEDVMGRLMIRANQGHTTLGQQDIVRLSKTLAFLLRHGAENLGFHFMPGGFLYVDELLRYHKPLNGFTIEQIKMLVRTNDKQRFYLQEDEEGRLMIRANQGHTTVVEGLDLCPVSDSSEVEMVLHGTYYQAWDQIQYTGLSRMNRNHIHFAAGMPGESGVISGMRKSCEVVIEIDLEKALKARIPFFRSANNVILSPGNDEGFIPPIFFKRVFDRHSGEELMPLNFLRSNSSSSLNTSLPSVQGAAEGRSLQPSLKRMKKASKDGPRSKKARHEKDGSSSESDTMQYEKEITTSEKLHNKKDKEKAKQMQSKDETSDRGKSRSDRDEKKGASKSQNETERNMSKRMKVPVENEEIALSHDAKGKERTVQVIKEDEKEVVETSNYRSGKGKGERIQFKLTARR